MFALVDCDCFYVSCERLFQPQLANQPVIVLSNNDGCVISRSKEAKALGIGMGVPYFSLKPLLAQHKIAVFSSNYALYGDISARIMHMLTEMAPACEIYSIDEAFLELSGIADPAALGCHIRATILQHIGIPVTIGIGHTKTLAKVAANHAKRASSHVYLLANEAEEQTAMLRTDIEDVWGIGRRLAFRFKRQGLHTAWDARNADDSWIRRHFSVTVLRTVHELRGMVSLSLSTQTAPKQSITVSRSFAKPIFQLAPLQEAMAHYVARAAAKLRAEKQVVSVMYIYARSSRFHPEKFAYQNTTVHLTEPTNDTPTLMKAAVPALTRIFQSGVAYSKCGVILLDLMPAEAKQISLFAPQHTHQNKAKMLLMDTLNRKMGMGTLFFASEGTKKPWLGQSSLRSPSYTTSWKEILVVGE